MVIKARFDGQVFVSEQPVNLPPGGVVEIALPTNAPEPTPLARLAEVLAQYPDDPDWPADGPARHDDYLHGEARRPGFWSIRGSSWR